MSGDPCQCQFCKAGYPVTEKTTMALCNSDRIPTGGFLSIPTTTATYIFRTMTPVVPKDESDAALKLKLKLRQTPRERANKNQPFYRKLKGRKERW